MARTEAELEAGHKFSEVKILARTSLDKAQPRHFCWLTSTCFARDILLQSLIMASPFQTVSAHRYSQMANTLYEALHSQNKVKSHSRSLFAGRCERCFRGSEGVAALLSLRFCRSSEEAVRFGNDLIEYGFIVSVKGVGHRFKNKPSSLYRFWRDGGAGKAGEVAVPGPSPTGAQVSRLHADGMSMASTTGGSVHSYSEHEEDPAGSDRHIRDFTPDKTQGTPPSKRTIESPAAVSVAGIAQMHSRRSVPTSPRSATAAAMAEPAHAGTASMPVTSSAGAAPPSHPHARPPAPGSGRLTPHKSVQSGSRPFKPRTQGTELAPAPAEGNKHTSKLAQQDLHSITPPPSLHIPDSMQAQGAQLGGALSAQAALPPQPVFSQPTSEAAVADFDLASLSNQLIDVHEQLLLLNSRPSNGRVGLGGALLQFLMEELLYGQAQSEHLEHIGSMYIFFMVFRVFLVFVLFLAAACGALAVPFVAIAGRMGGVEGAIVCTATLLPPLWLAIAFSNSRTLSLFRLERASAQQAASTLGGAQGREPEPSTGGRPAAAGGSGAAEDLPVLDMQRVVQQAREASTLRRRVGAAS